MSSPTTARPAATLRLDWVARFPAAETTVTLGDFAFHRLDLAGGRLVGGPAQARNLSREHFAQAATVS